MLLFSIYMGDPLVLMLVGEWSYGRADKEEKIHYSSWMFIHSFILYIYMMEDNDQRELRK